MGITKRVTAMPTVVAPIEHRELGLAFGACITIRKAVNIFVEE
jgi:hypothetical protein